MKIQKWSLWVQWICQVSIIRFPHSLAQLVVMLHTAVVVVVVDEETTGVAMVIKEAMIMIDTATIATVEEDATMKDTVVGLMTGMLEEVMVLHNHPTLQEDTITAIVIHTIVVIEAAVEIRLYPVEALEMTGATVALIVAAMITLLGVMEILGEETIMPMHLLQDHHQGKLDKNSQLSQIRSVNCLQNMANDCKFCRPYFITVPRQVQNKTNKTLLQNLS
jgi:hypothetical protein